MRVTKPRMGRPPLPEGEARTVFTVRLNITEREAIEAAARRAGIPATVWARDALLNLARSADTTPPGATRR